MEHPGRRSELELLAGLGEAARERAIRVLRCQEAGGAHTTIRQDADAYPALSPGGPRVPAQARLEACTERPVPGAACAREQSALSEYVGSSMHLRQRPQRLRVHDDAHGGMKAPAVARVARVTIATDVPARDRFVGRRRRNDARGTARAVTGWIGLNPLILDELRLRSSSEVSSSTAQAVNDVRYREKRAPRRY